MYYNRKIFTICWERIHLKGDISKYVILTLIIALGVFIGNYALEKYQTYQVNKTFEAEIEVQDKKELYDNVVVDQFEKFGSNTWSIKITNYNTRKIYGDITIHILDEEEKELDVEFVKIPSDGLAPYETYEYKGVWNHDEIDVEKAEKYIVDKSVH